MVVDSRMMPFLATYWPHLMGCLFIYVLTYLWFDRSKDQPQSNRGQSQSDRGQMRPEVNKKKSLKDLNDNEEITEDSEEEDDISPALQNVQHIPYDHTPLSQDEMIAKSQAFFDQMKTRRTLRFFSDAQIPKTVIKNIILTAGTSPSGAHTEPWTYVVVTNNAMKDEIRDIVETEERINYEKRMGKQWTVDLKPLNTNWEKEYLTRAPALVLLFKQTYGILPNGGKKVHYYNEISCSISAGLFIAAVHNAGLVTLTSTPLNCGPALRHLLGRPVNEKLIMLLPIGYPDKGATVPTLTRKPIDEIMVYVD